MGEKKTSRRSLWAVGGLALVTLALAAALLTPGGSAREAAPAPDSGVNREEPTNVIVPEEYLPSDDGVITLTGPEPDITALRRALESRPDTVRVDAPEAEIAPTEQLSLRRDYPGVEFLWPVELFGHRFSSEVTEISLAGRTDLTAGSLLRIREYAPLFPGLRTIDLTGCGLPDRELHALDAALPDTDVVWTFRVYGREVCSTDEEVDLSGLILRDKGAEIEAALPLFSRLKKVVMCNCGISDEEMDALNRRHEDVRFVWMVNILTAAIRTDADFYIPYRSSGVKQTGINAGYRALKYCPDLIALDVGHSSSRDFSYLDGMPHMKYFIMVECYPTDMTPIGNLKELEWLEMFQCVTKDISPLVNCTALRDLNVCYVVCPRDNLYETLRQMTWLRRLWCPGTTMTRDQVAALREALPNTEIWCKTGDESTGSTWRFDEDYYDMRDAFHMYYMDITGSRTRRLTPEELQAVHKRFWKE